ncbi:MULTISPECIES: DeoR/GlpR family DNA-binding transcription regulator [Corynebacterium]|uniref:DeoR family transcriptional regulator n=2 Tax=Corynebacterium TaxID=1716 RepID=A0ABD0BGB0_CORUL|nr:MULTISPECIES: DeoR/GlpR family DNA-binding transcription regulator [Corynebacterium]AEG81407.1 DeoR-family transcription regulator [Corynebacterium ulcerans 809]AIU32465.1 Glycerol-3-phosphate regulon repressor [Corynebacterium ramonii FRC0011]AKA96432.1 DeoR faimly transcriptional regulator [Corynebacterium ulcerans]ESU58504.1 DeoR faimly transcriptional regulator [Corynebacterium ulcerans NCTC 12077]KKO87635.1 DeoR faimly transcriptional regulator [Corynebacterium ulcerans]
MEQHERHRVIIRAVDSGGKTIAQLCEITGASAVTIRRDLSELDALGAVDRVRGGARPAHRRGAHYPLEVRKHEQPAAKRAIAKEAARMVDSGFSVLVDSGTTPLEAAKLLAGKDIHALALSLYAGAALARGSETSVLIPGGDVNNEDLAIWGAAAVETVLSMRFDLAFIGVCACDPSVGVMSPNLNEATLKRAVFQASRRVVVLATPEKFSRVSSHRVATFDQVDTVITTNDIDMDIVERLTELGTNVVMVPAFDE